MKKKPRHRFRIPHVADGRLSHRRHQLPEGHDEKSAVDQCKIESQKLSWFFLEQNLSCHDNLKEWSVEITFTTFDLIYKIWIFLLFAVSITISCTTKYRICVPYLWTIYVFLNIYISHISLLMIFFEIRPEFIILQRF